ncbi:hypothetical protein DNK48_35800 [Streptomyces malaysiensis subsp. malaysiensis]|nr:hypothetical protein DNK48_35800 [Streptomyces malaysiensis]
MSRSIASLPMPIAWSSVRRAPARPPRASAMASRMVRNSVVQRPCRKVSPGICSANVFFGQSELTQKNRRTRR